MKGRCVECINFQRQKNDSFYDPKEQTCSYHKGYITHNALRKLECVAYQYEGDMEILDADIGWMLHCANDPYLMVLVDRIPRQRDLIYKRLNVNGSLMLLAESRGYVSFMCRSADLTQDTEGFGGHHFKLNVFGSDGFTITEIEFNGAWSSRSSVMNLFYNTKSNEVSISANPEGFKVKRGFLGAHMRLDLVKKAIEVFNDKSEIKAELVQQERDYLAGELGYFIKRADIKNPCQTCKGFGYYLSRSYSSRKEKQEVCYSCGGSGVKIGKD